MLDRCQVVDYEYNDQRWLKQINDVLPLEPEPPIFEELRPADPTDLFYLRLNYDTKDDAVNAPIQRNGNISNLRWQVLGDNNVHKYGFKYDFLDRVRNATYAFGGTVNNAYTTGYSYDLRGNLLKLNRKGKYGNNIQDIDKLMYGYFPATNQVQTITDNAECPTVLELAEPIFDNQDLRGTEVVRLLPGFSFSGRNGTLTVKNNCDVPFPYTKGFQQRSTASYQYDANGNQTFDPNKNLTVSYNHLNLPYRTVWSNGNQLDWLYDATGRKWRKTASAQGIVQSKRDYIHNREYRNDTLETIYFADGRVVSENGGFTYQYVLRDHLGNSRVVFQDDGTGKAVIVEVAAFYPFGLQIEELSGSFKQPKFGYLFNGKELETDFGLNLNDFGNRRQDPATGLFTTIDRFAEKYASFSPFSYAANNPIKNIDVNGDSIWVTAETVINPDGSYTNYQTIRGTVKVLDATGLVKNLDEITNQFESALKNSLKGRDGSIIIRSEIDVQSVESMNDVSASDHLMVIVDDVVPDGVFSSTVGLASMNGKIAYAEKTNNLVSTMVHELGHNMGLEHNWEDGLQDSKGDQNHMSYGGSKRSSFSNSQVVQIKRNASDLNQGANHTISPVTTNNLLWHTSSNRYPYLFNVNRGDKIPLQLKL